MKASELFDLKEVFEMTQKNELEGNNSKLNDGLVCENCDHFSQNFENEGMGDYPVDDLCAIAEDPCMDRDGPNKLWKSCPLKKAN